MCRYGSLIYIKPSGYFQLPAFHFLYSKTQDIRKLEWHVCLFIISSVQKKKPQEAKYLNLRAIF